MNSDINNFRDELDKELQGALSKMEIEHQYKLKSFLDDLDFRCLSDYFSLFFRRID